MTTALLDRGANISAILEKFFRLLLQKPQLLKVCMQNIISASGANLGQIGQFDLTFRLGNKQFTNRFIILQNLYRNIILGHNWQCNYRKGCHWNVNGQQYITHNSKFLCTGITSSNMEPTVWNPGALALAL